MPSSGPIAKSSSRPSSLRIADTAQRSAGMSFRLSPMMPGATSATRGEMRQGESDGCRLSGSAGGTSGGRSEEAAGERQEGIFFVSFRTSNFCLPKMGSPRPRLGGAAGVDLRFAWRSNF